MSRERPTSAERATVNRWRVYNFVCRYLYEHGWAPTYSEIAQGCGLGKSTVHVHLHRLHELGDLRVGQGPRMIALPRPNSKVVE